MGGDMADHDMGSGDMAGHGGDSCGDSSMSMGCGGLSCASTLAFVHENMVMHHGMAIEFTCDVEVDFVRGMIPHHAGAVKMCDILRGSVGVETDSDGSGMGMMHSGRMQMPAAIDPFLEGLCSDIEETQAREIAAMEAWLTSRSVGAYTSCDSSSSVICQMGMAMGCGDTSCPSTSRFVHENIRRQGARANPVAGPTTHRATATSAQAFDDAAKKPSHVPQARPRGARPTSTSETVLVGHVHMAKTAGTSLNGLLASRYERVCGHKGYSYDSYGANLRMAAGK